MVTFEHFQPCFPVEDEGKEFFLDGERVNHRRFPSPSFTSPYWLRRERDVVNFPGFVDCIYLNAPRALQLDNGLGDIISIRNTNWSDAVLWNPYLQMEACYKDFVCVENAKIGKVELEPGKSWAAEQHLSVG